MLYVEAGKWAESMEGDEISAFDKNIEKGTVALLYPLGSLTARQTDFT